jgi:PAS domain S-box-containing protein
VPPSRAAEDASVTEASLLLVDDETTNCLVFEQIIKEYLPECRLSIANDAGMAWEMASANPPDCAVVDVFMPGVNGIELCRRLKQRSDTNSFPILLITSADVDQKMQQEGLEAGADDFLHRPVGAVELCAKLRVMLRMKHAEDRLRNLNARLIEILGERSKALHESDERYRMVLQATSDLVLVFSLTEEGQAGEILEVNDSACELLGYSRDSLVGLAFSDLIPADRQTSLPSRIESIRVHRELDFDITLLSREGRQAELRVIARLLEFNDRFTVILVGRESSTPGRRGGRRDSGRFRLLAARTGQMVYELDVASMQVVLSGAITQVTGYTQEDVRNWQGGRWMELFHPDDRERVLADFDSALGHVGKYLLQYRFKHKSGQWRNVEDQAVVIPGEDGRAARVIGTIKDITGRLKQEEDRRKQDLRLQHSQRLESLGVLAGGIAHDFNNILAGINGLTEIALQELDPESGIHRDLTQVLQAGHRARDLVRQILAFSRQSGEERAVMRLQQVVHEVTKLMRASIQHDRTITIVEHVRENTAPVKCNAAQIHQVLMNMCTNATYALHKSGGGTLSLSIENAEVDEVMARSYPRLRPGPHVKITVHDTGHGMSASIVPRIFDPFFTTKGPGEGTGLGLSVAHGNVSDHNGAILVESTPGQGTTFEIYLPAASKQAILRAEESSRVAARGRALVVEPEELVMRFLQPALAKLGYACVTCDSAEEALQRLEGDASFDVLIADMILPGSLDGEALAAAARERFPVLPTILLSSFTDKKAFSRPENSAASYVLAKPLLLEDLTRAMQYVRLGEVSDRGSKA